ncbi:MAG: nitronate monooxygenase [Solirubrobacteraceae bacterium]|nr:nitronate monooxygenase [Solirubrobacteraceae bacterium]
MSPRRFTELVGCRLPVQLASLGGPIGTPALAAAVSEAGGLGTIPNPSSAAEVEQTVEAARGLTSQPIAVGFLIPFLSRDALAAAARSADVVEFFYGDPDPELVGLARSHGAVVGWQAGSAAECEAAEAAGCDFVVIQGVEAGGHVRGTQRLDDALAQTLAAVDVPVVAAGGIGTSERVRELLAAGADAVRVGTRFVAAEESDAHPAYVARLVKASRHDTVLTGAFATGWPDAPHRVLGSAVTAAERLVGRTVATLGEREIPVFASMPPTRQAQGEIEAMALYAGESVEAVTRTQPAADILSELAAGL